MDLSCKDISEGSTGGTVDTFMILGQICRAGSCGVYSVLLGLIRGARKHRSLTHRLLYHFSSTKPPACFTGSTCDACVQPVAAASCFDHSRKCFAHDDQQYFRQRQRIMTESVGESSGSQRQSLGPLTSCMKLGETHTDLATLLLGLLPPISWRNLRLHGCLRLDPLSLQSVRSIRNEKECRFYYPAVVVGDAASSSSSSLSLLSAYLTTLPNLPNWNRKLKKPRSKIRSPDINTEI